MPKALVKTGQRLYQWLDGSDRFLAQLLAEAKEGVVLAIATEARLAHLPWEVLHDGQSFLVARTHPVVVPVRWQCGNEGSSDTRALSWREVAVPNRPLQTLFMATSPIGVEPVLDFELEEARILEATQRQPLTLTVEESGCLDELTYLLGSHEPGHFDVVHLMGHAGIGEAGPRFITESETGARVFASPQDIAKALQFRFPELVFLSGCRTGQSGRAGEVPSMAAALIESGARAVLGWGRPVHDADGILAAETLYAALAAAKTLPEAVALTYQAMIGANARDWHLLRLYVTGALPQNLVTPLRTRGRARAPKASMTTEFLDTAGKVKVPGRGSFVGRRRPLQNCLRALQSPDGLGVLLYGMGGLGKSSLAARICDRLHDYTRIVWFGVLDEAALVNRLADVVSDRNLRQHLQDPNEALKYRLRDVFSAETDATYLLVLDDFEANLEALAEGYRLKAEGARVLGALTWAMEQAALEHQLGHQLLITCRYEFDFSGLANVYKQPLAGLQKADLRKKCAQLEAFARNSKIEKEMRDRALVLADGNPRLLEWLDKVLCSPGEVSLGAVLDALENEKRGELREQVLASSLLAQMDEPMKEMLGRALVYELPVPSEAVVAVCEGLSDVERLIDRAVALGVLEQSPEGALRVPRVLPVVLSDDEALVVQAAQVLYRIWWEKSESSSEEQKLEIHRLAIKGKSREIAGEISYYLAGKFRSKSRYREAISLCQRTIEVAPMHKVWKELATAARDIGNINLATDSFYWSLKNFPEEEEQLKDSILYELGILKTQQRDMDGALTLFQQSLEIQDKIGNMNGKASTLHELGMLKSQKGDVEGAIALYQQSLEIKEKIGDAQGKAATLHQLAILKAQSGEVEGAIALYQQSLEIKEKIGDAQGKAETLAMLGQLLADEKGETETAISYLQDSLTILEKIGSPSAQTVQNIIYRISGQ